MKTLQNYRISFIGLKDAIYEFEYQTDKSFFESFEDSPISDGAVKIHLSLDKRPEMFVLSLSFEGTLKTDCDRCLELFDLPISSEQELLIKFGDPVNNQAEIIYISPADTYLDTAQYLYEYILLSMPIKKVCDIEDNPSCNNTILKYLNTQEETIEEEDPDEEKSNSIWNALDDLKDLD